MLEINSEKTLTADLVYGRHHNLDARSTFKAVQRVAEQRLSGSKSGKLCIIIEDVGFPERLSQVVENSINQGFTPSAVYAVSSYMLSHNGELPSPEHLREERSNQLKDGTFFSAELAMLDRLFKRFGSGRLGVIWESMSLDQYEKLPEEGFAEHASKVDQAVRVNVLNGKFNQGMEIFTSHAIAIDQLSMDREDRFVERMVGKAKNDPNLIGFVGFLGAGHLSVSRSLRRLGVVVNNIFPQRGKDGAFHFSPDTILNIIRRFSPDREISETEWYKAMLGSVLHDLVYILNDGQVKTKEDQSLILSLRDYLENMKSMDDIRRLERKIRKEGWKEALTVST